MRPIGQKSGQKMDRIWTACPEIKLIFNLRYITDIDTHAFTGVVLLYFNLRLSCIFLFPQLYVFSLSYKNRNFSCNDLLAFFFIVSTTLLKHIWWYYHV